MGVSRLAAAGAVLILEASNGHDASPQARPTSPPPVEGDRIAIGSADVNRYEVMYGPGEFRTLDEDAASWPMRTAIRTIGRLEPKPVGGQGGAASPRGQGRSALWDHPLARHRICGEPRPCIALVEVQEMAGVLDGPARDWFNRRIEVIGALAEMGNQGDRSVAFQVWSLFEVPDRPTRDPGSKGSSLEPLVRYPKGAEGREVTVKGVFRGANLFEDLEPDSRRRTSDWVLQDGPFSIWVTGKAPKGKNFSLDPRSRSDCIYRLSVTGVVEAENDYVYLRATAVELLGRVKNEE
jgi:hypothetical protein